MTPIAVRNSRLLLLIHGSVSLVPAVTAPSRCDIESARSALALLLVITVAAAPATTDVRGLLALAHAWSTLAHFYTSAARRPTVHISGLPHALRAREITPRVQETRHHVLIPSLGVGLWGVLFQ